MTMTMTRRYFVAVSLLLCGGLLSVASGWDESRTDEDWRQPAVDVQDVTWVVANLYDGQNAVPENLAITLTLGERDFASNAQQSLSEVLLYRADDLETVPFEVTMTWEGATLTPVDWLTPHTDYVLDLRHMIVHIVSKRQLPPPIHFSTRLAPRVLGIWRNDSTLILEFSRTMDADTLYVGAQSVDVLWEEQGELVSLAMDHNLAAFSWMASDRLFQLAPFDPPGDVWIKISGDVRGSDGEPLDGDGDGVAGPGPGADDYLVRVNADALPACFTRADIPRPCMMLEDIPTLTTW